MRGTGCIVGGVEIIGCLVGGGGMGLVCVPTGVGMVVGDCTGLNWVAGLV